MPRAPRIVCPNIPYHVTQHGIREIAMFQTDADRLVYLSTLRKYAERSHLHVWAWCLMTTHAHLIVVPENEQSMAEAFRCTHSVYTGYRNALDGTRGHGWKARFYSCPLDRQHLWMAMRYVEMNPVRASMVARPEDWPWSSARAHLQGDDIYGMLDTSVWQDAFGPDAWAAFVEAGEDPVLTDQLRRSTRTGNPLGSEQFVSSIGLRVGRDFTPRKRGRKKRAGAGPLETQMVLEIGE